MKTTYSFIRYAVLSVLLLASSLWLAGCKKESASITTDVAFNFYMGSDVLWAAYAPAHSATPVYVDEFIAQKGPIYAGSNLPFPYLVYGYNTREYPQLIKQGQVLYSRFRSGAHRLQFTDAVNSMIADTTISPDAGSFTCIYLMDVAGIAGAKAGFKLLVVSEERTKAPDGRTGVRFVHLSPDAGDLEAEIIGEDGAVKTALTPKLQYAGITGYQYPDSANVYGGILHFKLTNTISGKSILTGVPFQPGARYTLVITGFANAQQRQVAMEKQADGSISYQQVNVPANLRAEIRRMY